jgi:hypothetical protein
VLVEEIDQLGQVPQVLAGSPCKSRSSPDSREAVHRVDHLAVDALAFPVLPRAVGDRRPWGRPAKCRCSPRAGGGKAIGRVVQQRGVGLDAEAEIAGKRSMPAKTASRFSSGSAPWKTICGSVPLGTRGLRNTASADRQGFQQLARADMCCPAAHLAPGCSNRCS